MMRPPLPTRVGLIALLVENPMPRITAAGLPAKGEMGILWEWGRDDGAGGGKGVS